MSSLTISENPQSSAVDIRLKGITKAFSGVTTVYPLDLEIRAGEFFSLLGPSGCGKTTTLRMIAGLEEPSTGSIEIQGRPMEGVPVNRRPTNLVFQKLALFPHLNVFENIVFGLKLAGVEKHECKSRVGRMLDLVRLSGYEQRSVTSLSGGQQQRVAIARALVNRPAVLLLDEPLGALDLQLQLHLQRELARIQRELGTTFVYVTHNQAEALALSDRVAVMNAGRIEQVAEPVDLFRKPASRFVAEFMGQTNLLSGEVTRREQDFVTALAAGVEFKMEDNGSLTTGQPVTLSVRPERIMLGAGGAFQVRLRLVDRIFQGAAVLYRFALPSGGELMVHGLASADPTPEIGEFLEISWNVGAAIIVPGTAG